MNAMKISRSGSSNLEEDPGRVELSNWIVSNNKDFSGAVVRVWIKASELARSHEPFRI